MLKFSYLRVGRWEWGSIGDFGTDQAFVNNSVVLEFLLELRVQQCLTVMSISEIHKNKILVVGDDLDVNTTIVFLLEFDGHAVRTVDTGEAALAMLEKMKFDLIITEYWLPLMKGDEFAALVKEQWPDQPIIMATAHFEGISVEDTSSFVVDCLLDKPFTMQQLREAMLWVMEGAPETRLNALASHRLPANAVVNPHKTQSASQDSRS